MTLNKDYKKIPVIPFWVVNITAFCVIVTVSFLLIEAHVRSKISQQSQINSLAVKTLPPPEQMAFNPYAGIELEAKAGIVYDVSNQRILYSKNAYAQLPLASITKLMTTIVASESLPNFTAIPIVKRETEYDPKLRVGETWLLGELLKYTLITSSNTGADSAALAVSAFLEGEGTSTSSDISGDRFIELMNNKAQEMGLKQTYFLNGSGLDTHGKIGGAYGSAYDVALLTAYMLTNHYDLFEFTREDTSDFTAQDGRTVEALNTNAIVSSIPGILGSKTGFTDLAGGNLSIAFDASFGEPFVVVVLGSSQEGRLTDSQKLIDATIEYFGVELLSPDI